MGSQDYKRRFSVSHGTEKPPKIISPLEFIWEEPGCEIQGSDAFLQEARFIKTSRPFSVSKFNQIARLIGLIGMEREILIWDGWNKAFGGWFHSGVCLWIWKDRKPIQENYSYGEILGIVQMLECILWNRVLRSSLLCKVFLLCW